MTQRSPSPSASIPVTKQLTNHISGKRPTPGFKTSFKQRLNSCAKLAAIVIAGLGLGSCAEPISQQVIDRPDKPNVVATSTMLWDLTDRVGGDEIDLVGILRPGADPHIYEPVPRDIVAIEAAELIFYNGYNLEPALIKLITASGINAEKIALGELVEPLDFDYQGKTAPDPHVWGSARNAIVMVEAIREYLTELSPEDAALFAQNADQLIAELKQLDQWITVQIATIPESQRYLVTTHDAFQYYAVAYDIPVAGTLIGISTEEQPSAQTVKNLSDTIKELGVPTIFAESTINPALIKTVAAEAGVNLAEQKLYSDSIGSLDSEANSYVMMLVVNTRTIVNGLGGNYENFEPSEQ
ncbi:ABC-type metal ion transporter, periplasmic subunit [Thalassoporum mexicanum PCC 7367]|uniref:metal ABC transporter solute-binding protein, Zn/Mn family n=1 Tax=Thalassoporum mexicanum TaxID=3457544 RepID=UPI00029F8147|nr:zinc ABC transporter substrate-binding protein [Pseudanabaena sp. PCC 7367]AFY68958.1 ABC-type metal ion transporter, periplasmic subunit [Pseudanabaena sp. PCC 7367]